ncbi:MAG: DUF3553 domain-containing protein [Nitrospirae bacterium]|nr:DUF3553 domain-containing protein [Nitrospirota bacterium]
MLKRLYLKVGDKVRHLKHESWGEGEVLEEKHSDLPGGGCFVSVSFDDGEDRYFINDLDHQCCCYYFGIRVL